MNMKEGEKFFDRLLKNDKSAVYLSVGIHLFRERNKLFRLVLDKTDSEGHTEHGCPEFANLDEIVPVIIKCANNTKEIGYSEFLCSIGSGTGEKADLFYHDFVINPDPDFECRSSDIFESLVRFLHSQDMISKDEDDEEEYRSGKEKRNKEAKAAKRSFDLKMKEFFDATMCCGRSGVSIPDMEDLYDILLEKRR